ncbi:ArgS-related anticodon-binding protein NrtL [Streptomyces sp. NPDC046887]|uniref:ArgS-related anticodon-binding protein NrtL n=1 Tax=Streptomyces sp. NPDC046887 TaxID=3155472 RepID=UPI0033F43378
MTPADLSVTVLRAVRRAVDEGALPRGVAVPERVVVERPRAGGCGDWATNAALRLAREAGMAPLAVAEVLSAALRGEPGIGRVDVTGPGFLNFTCERGVGGGVAAAVREVGVRGARYGFGEGMRGQRVELVCGGGVREGVYAEAVRGLLVAQGADVRVREGEDVSVVVRGAHYDPRGLGRDACQWALLRPAAGDRVLDGPPLLVQGEGNGLFLVRYAHARARALVRNAGEWGFAGECGDDLGASRLGGLIVEYPGVLEAAARLRAPDRVARALEAVADALLDFQHGVLPMGEEKPSAAHRSRLALAEAAGTVLAGGLALLGVSAPDHL